MDRKTENQLRQEIAEVWTLLDAERTGRAALIRRIEQEEQSVAVVGEPIYWIDPDDDANLSRISRVGWSPLYGESPASIPAADLARLREKAAQFDSADMEYLLGCKSAYQQELETRTKFQHELNALEQELERLRKKLASAEREREQSNARLHEVAVACATAEHTQRSILTHFQGKNDGEVQTQVDNPKD